MSNFFTSENSVPGVAILQPGVPVGRTSSEDYSFNLPSLEGACRNIQNNGGLPIGSVQVELARPQLFIRPIMDWQRTVNVIALQRWTGRVERVLSNRFVAIVHDITNPTNPAEEVELDLEEVSPADRGLVAEGAMFYWSIVYRDSKSGQRERIAAIRFARQPKLSDQDVEDIFREADEMIAFLESA